MSEEELQMFDDDRRDNNRVEQRDAEEEVTPYINNQNFLLHFL